MHGRLDLARCLLDHKAKVDELNASGLTPLMTAASNCQAKMIEFLIDRGAQIERRESSGKTALILASSTGQLRTQPPPYK